MTFGSGVAPEGIKFIAASAVLSSLSVAGERLLLRIEDETARLEAGELGLELPSWHECELQLNSIFPAKGEGFCELSLSDTTTNRFTKALFQGQFQNLDWMRDKAQSIAEMLHIGFQEVNLGGDA